MYRRQDAITQQVDLAMSELDTNNDGIVSFGTFQEFSRNNSLESLVTPLFQAILCCF